MCLNLSNSNSALLVSENPDLVTGSTVRMAEIFTVIEAVQGCVHTFHFNHDLVLPLRSSGALCSSILVVSRLAVESQTINIHGASEFGHTAQFRSIRHGL
jgi:hypothetical protein